VRMSILAGNAAMQSYQRLLGERRCSLDAVRLAGMVPPAGARGRNGAYEHTRREGLRGRISHGF